MLILPFLLFNLTFPLKLYYSFQPSDNSSISNTLKLNICYFRLRDKLPYGKLPFQKSPHGVLKNIPFFKLQVYANFKESYS